MPSFLSLPQETLSQICEHVASEDPPSIYELALTSKKCRVIANFYRFQHIYLTLVSHKKLATETDRWKKILQRNSAFPFVHELSVRGSMPPPGQDDGCMVPDFEDPNDGDLADELTCLGHYYRQDIGGLFNSVLQSSEGRDPLPAFVGRLSGLHHITWSSETLFPRSLLEILHDSLPRCKLHYMAFKLPSLCYKAQEPRDIDSYEYALATSPSLSSILVPVSFYDTHGNVEYNSEAALQLATGLAPNLSEVHLVHESPGSSPFFANAARQGRPQWRGFFANTRAEGLQNPSVSPANEQRCRAESTSHRGKSQDLSLSPANGEYFAAWESQEIFSQLRILRLWQVSAIWLRRAKAYSFPFLQALALDYQSSASVEEAGCDFISSLPPLKSVSLYGAGRDLSLQAVFRCHGKSLLKLSLICRGDKDSGERPVKINTIDHIRVACPHIRHLSLPILRARDPSEMATYKSVGEIVSLKDLTLQLLCRGLPDGPQPTIPNYKPSECHLRDWLLDAAVDSTLVSKIFDLVAQRSSLQRLRTSLCNKGSVQSSWSEILELMKRRWQCVRCESGTVVRELGAKARGVYQEEHMRNLGEFESAFRSLWPHESGNWTEDWTSFPLVQNPDTRNTK